MSLILDLPQELEHQLAKEATQLGLSLPEYALRLLSSENERRTTARARSGAELVDWWRREGVIGSRLDISDSSGHARQIRRKAERRGQAE
jgi:hypothetical protein